MGWRHGRSSTVPEPSQPSAELTPKQKRERFLLDAVEQYSRPGNDAEKLNLGLQHIVELAKFYLDEKRLEDAERLFTDLAKRNQPAYSFVGRLGKAVVLAYQDRTADSNAAFLKCLNERPPRLVERTINFRPVHVMVARALDHNRARKEQAAFPAKLDPVRNVNQRWIPEGARKSKASEKEL